MSDRTRTSTPVLDLDAQAAWDGAFRLRGEVLRFRHPSELEGIELPISVGRPRYGAIKRLFRWLFVDDAGVTSAQRGPFEAYLAQAIDDAHATAIAAQMSDTELSLAYRALARLTERWYTQSLASAQHAAESAGRQRGDGAAGTRGARAQGPVASQGGGGPIRFVGQRLSIAPQRGSGGS